MRLAERLIQQVIEGYPTKEPWYKELRKLVSTYKGKVEDYTASSGRTIVDVYVKGGDAKGLLAKIKSLNKKDIGWEIEDLSKSDFFHIRLKS